MSEPSSKSRPRPKRPLTRERILEAGVRLADKHGLAAVSMRRLAGALRVEAMSLYNHVANKDELLDGMVDLVVAEIELPALHGSWKAAMRRRASSAHAMLLRHPWAALPMVSRINVGPAMLRYVDRTLACLVEAGFSYALADRAWNAIDNHVYGFTLQAQNFPIAPEEYAQAAQAYLPMLSAETHPHLRALTELVARGKHHGVNDFGFGLELILEGLERILARR